MQLPLPMPSSRLTNSNFSAKPTAILPNPAQAIAPLSSFTDLSPGSFKFILQLLSGGTTRSAGNRIHEGPTCHDDISTMSGVAMMVLGCLFVPTPLPIVRLREYRPLVTILYHK